MTVKGTRDGFDVETAVIVFRPTDGRSYGSVQVPVPGVDRVTTSGAARLHGEPNGPRDYEGPSPPDLT